MTDFVPDPRDRLEAPICKAIEAKDYKQALKLVEKRLARGSDSYLQVSNCFLSTDANSRLFLCASMEHVKSSHVVISQADGHLSAIISVSLNS
jgi:hypothetical protein